MSTPISVLHASLCRPLRLCLCPCTPQGGAQDVQCAAAAAHVCATALEQAGHVRRAGAVGGLWVGWAEVDRLRVILGVGMRLVVVLCFGRKAACTVANVRAFLLCCRPEVPGHCSSHRPRGCLGVGLEGLRHLPWDALPAYASLFTCVVVRVLPDTMRLVDELCPNSKHEAVQNLCVPPGVRCARVRRHSRTSSRTWRWRCAGRGSRRPSGSAGRCVAGWDAESVMLGQGAGGLGVAGKELPAVDGHIATVATIGMRCDTTSTHHARTAMYEHVCNVHARAVMS